MDIKDLTQAEQEKLKKSYFNLLALFLSEPNVPSHYARSFIKWTAQMQISPDDIVKLGKDLVELKFSAPETESGKLEALFHLVYMIYLDRVIEDDELELAMAYAEKIGLRKTVVVNLFQSIATADSDGISHEKLEREVLTFMKTSREG